MLTHIVFIKFLDYDEKRKKELTRELKSRLDTLSDKIEVVEKLKTGMNISTRPSAYDIALIVEVENEAALDIYRSHPEHVKVLEFMKTLNIQTAVVDFY